MKQALTFDEQLDLLIRRHMILDVDRESALLFLAENNYYRLSGYFKLFCKDGSDDFADGFCFSHLKRLYIFDFDLRRILNDLLEEVEVTVKTQIAYCLSHKLSPDFYLDSSYFFNEDNHKILIDKIEAEKINNKTSPIVRRYDGETMPLWVLVELLPFGTISKMYSNLKYEYKKMVTGGNGNYYKYHHKALSSYLYVAVQLRNRCSHRARIYARYINAKMSYSQSDLLIFDKYSYPYEIDGSQCTIFFAIYAAFKLIKDKNCKQSYINKIQNLFVRYNDVVNPNLLGFFDHWDEVLLS